VLVSIPELALLKILAIGNHWGSSNNLNRTG
jgi:hypothetical protein